MPINTTIEPVLISHDMGQKVYDAVLTGRDIHRMMNNGLIRIDDDLQRGRNSTTGKQVFKEEKVQRWTNQLLKDDHVFGQLTWNFRPEETRIDFMEDETQLVIIDGSATLPDSAHRHRAIVRAVDSVSSGSSFDLDMKFSVRIWNVPADDEAAIFYGMNQEGDKADATRSKYLIQRNIGQRIARELVRTSPYMTESNVETVSNTLSTKNPRLAAFNTIAVACEQTYGETPEAAFADTVSYLVEFWDRLVAARPELGVLALQERQVARRTLLSSSALAIHGYLALAKKLRDEEASLDSLDALKAPTDGTEDFFAMANPEWQQRGIVVPGTNKSGKSTLSVRNAIQTRRAIADALAERVLPPSADSENPDAALSTAV